MKIKRVDPPGNKMLLADLNNGDFFEYDKTVFLLVDKLKPLAFDCQQKKPYEFAHGTDVYLLRSETKVW